MSDTYVASRAHVVADSISPSGVRITTWECEWPRFCHADLMTHRALSRNGRSSRAEPARRALQRAIDDPVRPLVWMHDAKRMAHGSRMNPAEQSRAEQLWWEARNNAVATVTELLDVGLHRQYVTRLIEPFLRIKMVVTATDFDNLYNVRIHPSPMPEVQQAVLAMARAQLASTPRKVNTGEWHLPYITDAERDEHPVEVLIKVSTSRCARISYDSLDGVPVPVADDVALHDRLIDAEPMHASPAEHQASAYFGNERSGNFRGWGQYRKHHIRENSEGFNLAERLRQYEGRDYIV